MDTVKRLCINKLPKVLVIQLKRFDYDWERLGADLSMEPINFVNEYVCVTVIV